MHTLLSHFPLLHPLPTRFRPMNALPLFVPRGNSTRSWVTSLAYPTTSRVRHTHHLSLSLTHLFTTAIPSGLERIVPDTESIWRKRKPTHLPPLLKLTSGTIDVPDSPTSVKSPVYHHRAPAAPNAPSTASGSSTSDMTQRRTKLERLRRKLGEEVPSTAVFPTTPHTAVPRTPRASTSSKKAHRSRTRSVVHQADDARSIAFSISSDESMHTVTFTTRVHSPRPHKTKHVYQTGALPPVPPIPAHLLGDDDAGLIRSRQKMASGSKIGGSDFKAARRAKREGRAQNGMAEPGELVEMVGFMAC